MRSRKLLAVAGLAIAGLALAACGDDDDTSTPATSAAAETTAATATTAAMAESDIVDTAVAAGSFTTLATALTEAGLVETLKGEGPFTVFAPTDEAFAKVPAETLEALLADKEALTRVLTYHVVAGNVPSSAVTAGPVEMVSGDTAEITLTDGKVMINDATVTATDVDASNGVIHVIDTVLVPPTVDPASLL
jgi:uncharacterized surface protein with fasciclin (FAS1) repeats